MSKETFIPAFPPNAGWRDADINCRGMTLRDYFAAAALTGICACESLHKKLLSSTGNGDPQHLAECCYLYADSMLAERAKC